MCYIAKLWNLQEDVSCIGLGKGSQEPYFCTPTNCTIFAHLGVDGVHFAHLNQEDKENAPIFLVNPMNPDRNAVPVANNLIEFLSLVAVTKDAGALEYIFSNSKESYLRLFEEACEEPEIEVACQVLKKEFPLLEITDTYDYVKSHVREDLVDLLEFSEEYWELKE